MNTGLEVPESCIIRQAKTLREKAMRDKKKYIYIFEIWQSRASLGPHVLFKADITWLYKRKIVCAFFASLCTFIKLNN